MVTRYWKLYYYVNFSSHLDKFSAPKPQKKKRPPPQSLGYWYTLIITKNHPHNFGSNQFTERKEVFQILRLRQNLNFESPLSCQQRKTFLLKRSNLKPKEIWNLRWNRKREPVVPQKAKTGKGEYFMIRLKREACSGLEDRLFKYDLNQFTDYTEGFSSLTRTAEIRKRVNPELPTVSLVVHIFTKEK